MPSAPRSGGAAGSDVALLKKRFSVPSGRFPADDKTGNCRVKHSKKRVAKKGFVSRFGIGETQVVSVPVVTYL